MIPTTRTTLVLQQPKPPPQNSRKERKVAFDKIRHVTERLDKDNWRSFKNTNGAIWDYCPRTKMNQTSCYFPVRTTTIGPF